MATFKVGQRVRKIALGGYTHETPIGSTGVIVPTANLAIGDEISWTPDAHQGIYYVHPWQLAPLTDPKADEFIESLKKLAREPSPVRDGAPAWDILPANVRVFTVIKAKP